MANEYIIEKCQKTGSEIKYKKQWLDIELSSDYSVSFRIINDSILQVVPKGCAGSDGIEKLDQEKNKIIRETGLAEKPFIEIKDYSGITVSPDRNQRKQFSRFLIESFNTTRMRGFIGYNIKMPMIRWIFNAGYYLFSRKLDLDKRKIYLKMVGTYEEAVARANDFLADSGKGNLFNPEEEHVIKQKHIDEIIDVLGQLNWEIDEEYEVSADNSLFAVADAIHILRNDFKQALARELRAEREFGEVERFNKIRLNMLESISRKDQGIEKMLDSFLEHIGSNLNFDRACFNVIEKDDFVCVNEYCREGIKPTLGIRFPYKIARYFFGTSSGLTELSVEKAMDHVPQGLKIFARPAIENFAKAIDLKYLLSLPVIYENNPYGVLSFNLCTSSDHVVTDSERKLLKECAWIITSALIQKKSQMEKNDLKTNMLHTSKLASIGELAAGVGHEINNPLAIISGFIGILRHDLDDGREIPREMIEKAVEKLDRASQRIKSIVDGLRTYARSDSDIIQMISIDEVISETLDLVGAIYEKSGIKIDIKCNSHDVRVSGNFGKMQQVLMNLLTNAKDAVSESTEKKISITSEVTDYGKGLRLCVSDTGSGIKKEMMDMIFEPFYTSKPMGKGTGLGLSVVKNIIESINGTIAVKSKPGTGTTFTLDFPAEKAGYSIEESVLEKITEYLLEGRALVVDDEEDIREILKEFLEDMGLECDLAASADEALERMKEASTPYKYVITDIMMPGSDGFTLLDAMDEEKFEYGKRYVITGVSSDERIQVLLDNEVIAGIIRKPFNKLDIFKLLKGEVDES